MTRWQDANVDRLETDGAGGEMDCFVRAANIAHYKKLIAESQRDPSRDENRHVTLLRLLAEEMAKEGDRCADIVGGPVRAPDSCAAANIVI
jgi:hypothetical protein